MHFRFWFLFVAVLHFSFFSFLSWNFLHRFVVYAQLCLSLTDLYIFPIKNSEERNRWCCWYFDYCGSLAWTKIFLNFGACLKATRGRSGMIKVILNVVRHRVRFVGLCWREIDLYAVVRKQNLRLVIELHVIYR